MRTALYLPVALLGTIACGTIASPGGGDLNLPTANVGPFTPLSQAEVAAGDVPPFVFLQEAAAYREPSAVAASDDASSPAVILYAVATGASGNVIVRTRADDGRSFYGDSVDQQSNASHRPPVVLKASQAWEGGSVSGPSALRVGSEVWLYYAAAGGIGLAKSNDGGMTFQALPQPVLAPDHGVGWEFTPPRAPSVAVFPDGSFHMLYASGDAIGEAVSASGDGGWQRVGGAPVLTASPRVDPSTLPEGAPPPFDEGAVDDPLLVPSVDVAGRLVVRVLYTGYAAPIGASSRPSAIGVAARFDASGVFTKQSSPVYSAQSGEAAPALLQFGGDQALLYVQQLNSALDMAHPFFAIAAAYAPASSMLGAPGAFPSSP
ncbi:MAG TPA: hypothetical protein VF765_20585 [Polyangiaceae bacterium]